MCSAALLPRLPAKSVPSSPNLFVISARFVAADSTDKHNSQAAASAPSENRRGVAVCSIYTVNSPGWQATSLLPQYVKKALCAAVMS